MAPPNQAPPADRVNLGSNLIGLKTKDEVSSRLAGTILRPRSSRSAEKSGLAPVTLDRGRTCSERVLARGLGHVPRFALVFASTGHQDLAGLDDLHLPAGASARVIAQLAGLHASGVTVAQAPDFRAGLRLSTLTNSLYGGRQTAGTRPVRRSDRVRDRYL